MTPRGGPPIAIVGMSGRFPGADDLPSFWRNLRNGVDSTGVALPGIDRWDEGFFAMSARDAALLDPQQRLFLECVWHALEDAGCDPARYPGRIGVFAGASLSTYLIDHVLGSVPFAGRPDELAVLLANDKDYLATRVSYLLGLRGPSVGVQTACSTSLVAIHLARQSLICGDCDMAIAGAVTIRVPEAAQHRPQEEGYLSRDARCRAFDAAAGGTVFGNGVGAVVLKSLDRAVAGRDRIHAVIRGSAINNDGSRKIGFVAPSVEGQATLVADALRAAGLAPGEISYVEAHGTGTALGDPIEVEALSRAFGPDVPRSRIPIGSVKTNVGHLESVAGLAGLMKVVLALQHGELPPSLHFERPNPHIRFEASPFHVNASLRPWISAGPRRAGVSSFGIGGTNAHVIVEEAPADRAAGSPEDSRAELLVWSARSDGAVTVLAGSYAQRLREPGPGAYEVCAAASHRRAAHAWRAATVGRSRRQLAENATKLAAGLTGGDVLRGHAGGPRKVAFVFGGQGGQWPGMGRELYAEEPRFRDTLDECDALVRDAAGWSVLEELESGARSAITGESIEVTQTSVFAVQVGLTSLWRHWGIAPAAVVGHSMGEVAAAAAAGALSLREAVDLICLRGRLLDAARGSGGMLAIELDAGAVEATLAAEPDVSVAAINAPNAFVLSGPLAALTRVAARLESGGLRAHWLRTGGVAGHSPAVAGAAAALAAQWRGRCGAPPCIPWASTVTGDWMDAAGPGAQYWQDNVRAPVRFADAVRRLAAARCDTFLEIGPHPVLGLAIAEQLQAIGHPHILVASLRREAPGRETVLTALGALYCSGCDVEWSSVYPLPVPAVPLPSYPFQRRRHWIDARAAHPVAATGLLGIRVDAAGDSRSHYWQARWSAATDALLSGHRVDGTPVVAATVLLSLAASGITQLRAGESAALALEAVTLHEPILLPDDGSRQVQLEISRGADGSLPFRISSRAGDAGPDDAWVLHATGRSPAVTTLPNAATLSIQDADRRCPSPWSSEQHYDAMALRGIRYRGPFRRIDGLTRGSGEAVGRVGETGPDHVASPLAFDPGLADGALQVLESTLGGAPEDLYVPRSIDRLTMHAGAGAAFAHATMTSGGPDGHARGDALLVDAGGTAVMELRGVALQRVSRTVSLAADAVPAHSGVYQVTWVDAPPIRRDAIEGTPGDWWLLLADTGGLAAGIARHPGAEPCELVHRDDLDRHEPDDFRRIFHRLAASRGRAPTCVAHLWPTDMAIPAHDVDDVAARARGGCTDFLHVIQALDVFTDAPPALAVVTAGAHQVNAEDSPSRFAQLAVVAMARVVVHEHPELEVRAFDLPDAPSATDLDALLDALRSRAGVSESAIRRGRVRHPELARVEGTRLETTNDRRGVWVLSGGMGGLGLELAESLAGAGATGIALLTRRPPSARVSTRIEEWRARGVDVWVVPTDVSRYEEVETAIASVVQRHGAIAGVVHLACTLSDGLLRDQTGARLAEVFAPKAEGAWNLHRATRDVRLEAFVLFSSAGALLGSPGQANYAAANAFLDGLAAFRRAAGLPATSIGWGNWAEAGRSASAESQARLQARGLRGIATADALATLWRVLRGSPAHVCVPNVDVGLWAQFHPHAARSSMWSSVSRPTAPIEAVRERGRPRRGVLTSLRESIAAVLGTPVREIDCRRPFQSLGLDSLRALELRSRLEGEFGFRISATSFWKHPTAERLAEALEQQVGR